MPSERRFMFTVLALLTGGVFIIGAFTASPESTFRHHVSIVYLCLPSQVQCFLDSLTTENARGAINKYSQPEQYEVVLNYLAALLQRFSEWTIPLMDACLQYLLILLASFSKVLGHSTHGIWNSYGSPSIKSAIAGARHVITITAIIVAESYRTTQDLKTRLSPRVGESTAWLAVSLYAYGSFRILARIHGVVAMMAHSGARGGRRVRSAAGRFGAMTRRLQRRVGWLRFGSRVLLVVTAGMLLIGWMALDRGTGATAPVVVGDAALEMPDVVHDRDMLLGIYGAKDGMAKDRKGVAYEAIPTLPIEGEDGSIGNVNQGLKAGRRRGAQYLWW